MLELIKSKIGWLRILGFFEGMSLLVLLFIAMPLKYIFQKPETTSIVGAIHGGLFVLFVFYVIVMAVQNNWKFSVITWKLLLASVVPFGTFYADKVILSKMDANE
ncbi:MAG: DUF3817 domain-containing protein [Bacteroidetes bacterium]|nr:DUF3817 domain-containing protein [Bacteroidota bacterium]